MKNLLIEKIVLDFGSTLVAVSETVNGVANGNGYYKFEGEITNEDCLLFMLINCPQSYVACSSFEESMFINYDDL